MAIPPDSWHETGYKGELLLELALLDPQVSREVGIVVPNFLDEPLCVLAPDEHLELDAEREVGERAR